MSKKVIHLDLYKSIENPMVNDSVWKEFEKELKIFGTCEGCKETLYKGDNVIEYDDDMIHNDSFCCYEYLLRIGKDYIL